MVDSRTLGQPTSWAPKLWSPLPSTLQLLLRQVFTIWSISHHSLFCTLPSKINNLKKHTFCVAVVSKASSGVLEVFPPVSVASASDFLEKSREAGWRVFGADCSVDNSQGEGEASNSRDDGSPSVLVLGSEGSGLPQDLRPLCHSGAYFSHFKKMSNVFVTRVSCRLHKSSSRPPRPSPRRGLAKRVRGQRALGSEDDVDLKMNCFGN